MVWPSEAPKHPQRSRSTPRRPCQAERTHEDEAERDRRVGARGQHEPEEEQEADDPLRPDDAPSNRRRGPGGHAVGSQPVGKVLPATQLCRRGPEQQKADDDPGDSRQVNHCRS